MATLTTKPSQRSSIWFALTLILLASLLSGVNSASAASNESRLNKHEKQSHANVTSTQQSAPIPTVPLSVYESSQSALRETLGALHAEQEARAKDDRASHEAHVANRISFGLLIVGIVYSFFAWKQWAEIKNQATIANAALTETRKAADAAQRSADALALTERAFVLLDDRESPDPREKEELTYRVTNGGHTPAYIKRLTCCVRLGAPGSGGIPATLYDPTVSYKTAPDIAVLGPEQTFVGVESIGPADYISQSVEQQIRSKQRALWFWGFVAYVDAFKQEHVSEWCRFWVPSSDTDQGLWQLVEEPDRNIAT